MVRKQRGRRQYREGASPRRRPRRKPFSFGNTTQRRGFFFWFVSSETAEFGGREVRRIGNRRGSHLTFSRILAVLLVFLYC
jgi:hypothetical protein